MATPKPRDDYLCFKFSNRVAHSHCESQSIDSTLFHLVSNFYLFFPYFICFYSLFYFVSGHDSVLLQDLEIGKMELLLDDLFIEKVDF